MPESSSSTPERPNARTSALVLLDPGHGGHDPGAVANGLHEASLNLAVALLLAQELLARDVRIRQTRGPGFVSLKDRCALERELRPDCFVSLHHNAAADPRVQGAEVWTSPGETAADPLALAVAESWMRTFPGRAFRRGSESSIDKESHLYVLTHTRAPAVLFELGFLTHPDETYDLARSEWQQTAARALAEGICAWLAARRTA